MKLKSLPGNYLTTRHRRYYLQRRLAGKLVRVSLKTTEEDTAFQLAASLYLFTNDLKRLGVSHGASMRLVRNKASLLHDEVITRQLEQLTVNHTAQEALPVVETAESANTPDVENPQLVSDALEEALGDIQRVGGTSQENVRKYVEA